MHSNAFRVAFEKQRNGVEGMRLDLDECTMRMGSAEVPFMVFAPDEAWFRGKSLAEALGYNSPSHAVDVVMSVCKMPLAQLYELKGAPLKSPNKPNDKVFLRGGVQSTCTSHVRALDTKAPEGICAGLTDVRGGGNAAPTHAGILDHNSAKSMWVNESGLYELLLGCRKPEASAFKRWVLADVLPTLRKTGCYVMGLDENEKALISVFDSQPVLYMGTVGTYDGVELAKFGSSDKISRRITQEHKQEFDEFKLKLVIPVQRNLDAEKDFKAHTIIKEHKRKRVIKGKVQTELLELSHTFTLRDAENVMKMVALQRDIMQSTDMHRLIALAEDERTTKREAHELAMKKIEAEVEMKRLDHALEMKKLEVGVACLSCEEPPPPPVNVQERDVPFASGRVAVPNAAAHTENIETICIASVEGPNFQPRGVWQVHRQSGERIKLFPSATQAAIALGNHRGGRLENRAGSIQKCIRGIMGSYMGFKWERAAVNDGV